MTMELWMLLGVVVVFMTVIAVQAVALISTFGGPAAAGNRDTLDASKPGIVGRSHRTVQNHIEGLIIFAPLVLIGAVASISTPMTVLGAQIYLGSRIVHALSYLLGITKIRTLAFAAGMFSLILLLVGLIAS